MAGAQLLGGAVNAISTHRANKRNEENWKKQSLMNSAASQSSRLRAAGLAPYSAVSQIAANNKVDRAPDQLVSKFGEMIGNAGSAYGQGVDINSNVKSREFVNRLNESITALNNQQFDFLKDYLPESLNKLRAEIRDINALWLLHSQQHENAFEEGQWISPKLSSEVRSNNASAIQARETARNLYISTLYSALQYGIDKVTGIKKRLSEIDQMVSSSEANRSVARLNHVLANEKEAQLPFAELNAYLDVIESSSRTLNLSAQTISTLRHMELAEWRSILDTIDTGTNLADSIVRWFQENKKIDLQERSILSAEENEKRRNTVSQIGMALNLARVFIALSS